MNPKHNTYYIWHSRITNELSRTTHSIPRTTHSLPHTCITNNLPGTTHNTYTYYQ